MTPNAEDYIPDTNYLREIVQVTGLTTKEVSELIGIPVRTLQDLLSLTRLKHVHKYPVQYAIEMLAIENNPHGYFSLKGKYE